MTEPLRIVFLGSDPISLPLLDWIAGEGSEVARVIAVFTQPDRPVGRGQKITANGIKTWALAHDLPVYQPEKLTDDVRAQLAALSADVSLVMAYGQILKQEFIDTPRLGTLNLHASLLPHYRGASPIQTAVANGETQTGVSLMRIVRQLDAGPVADVERVAIEPRDTALEIEGKLSAACVPLLARTLPKLRAGELVFVDQDHAAATFCRRMVKDDGRLDFNASAKELAARINGLFPWPACNVEIAGQPIKIGLADVPPTLDASENAAADNALADASSTNCPSITLETAAVDGVSAPAGTTAASPQSGYVLGTDSEGLLVATGSGIVRLLRLQKPGGKLLPAPEFLRGFPIATGTILPSSPLPLLVGPVPFPYKRPTPTI